MVVLLIGLFLDVILFVAITAKNKNISLSIRFAAFSAVINLFAYCISSGLNETFGAHILFEIICAATSKIFILYVFGVFRQNAKTQNPAAYIMVVAVSLCIYDTPLTGIICGIILLAYLVFAEYSGKSEIKAETPPQAGENGLYLRTIEENYRKSRELWHDLNNQKSRNLRRI